MQQDQGNSFLDAIGLGQQTSATTATPLPEPSSGNSFLSAIGLDQPNPTRQAQSMAATASHPPDTGNAFLDALGLTQGSVSNGRLDLTPGNRYGEDSGNWSRIRDWVDEQGLGIPHNSLSHAGFAPVDPSTGNSVGHNGASLHSWGDAYDVPASAMKKETGDELIKRALRSGLEVIDERDRNHAYYLFTDGTSAYRRSIGRLPVQSGKDIHLQLPRHVDFSDKRWKRDPGLTQALQEIAPQTQEQRQAEAPVFNPSTQDVLSAQHLANAPTTSPNDIRYYSPEDATKAYQAAGLTPPPISPIEAPWKSSKMPFGMQEFHDMMARGDKTIPTTFIEDDGSESHGTMAAKYAKGIVARILGKDYVTHPMAEPIVDMNDAERNRNLYFGSNPPANWYKVNYFQQKKDEAASFAWNHVIDPRTGQYVIDPATGQPLEKTGIQKLGETTQQASSEFGHLPGAGLVKLYDVAGRSTGAPAGWLEDDPNSKLGGQIRRFGDLVSYAIPGVGTAQGINALVGTGGAMLQHGVGSTLRDMGGNAWDSVKGIFTDPDWANKGLDVLDTAVNAYMLTHAARLGIKGGKSLIGKITDFRFSADAMAAAAHDMGVPPDFVQDALDRNAVRAITPEAAHVEPQVIDDAASDLRNGTATPAQVGTAMEAAAKGERKPMQPLLPFNDITPQEFHQAAEHLGINNEELAAATDHYRIKPEDVVSRPQAEGAGTVPIEGGGDRGAAPRDVPARRVPETSAVAAVADTAAEPQHTNAAGRAGGVAKGSPDLQVGIPFVREFIEQDVAPGIDRAVTGAQQIADDLTSSLNPAAFDDASRTTAHMFREGGARLALDTNRIQSALKNARKFFATSMTRDQRLQFIDNMEKGQPQASPALDSIAKSLRTAMDIRRDALVGIGKLQTVIENYFPHLWQGKTKIGAIYGKRPFEGGKGFLKQRVFQTVDEGIKAGYRPITDNPVELTQLRIHEMDRFLMAHHVWNQMKAEGVLKFFRWNEKVPDGYKEIEDRIARVYEGVTDQGSLAERGAYYAPHGAATVLNNYLSPGLRGKTWYDAVRGSANLLNQAQLGLSMFHAGFVTFDSIASKFALATRQLGEAATSARKGDIAGAAKYVGKGAWNITKSLYAPVETYFKGDKLLKAAMRGDPTLERFVDALLAGGGRVKMDDFYSSDAWKNFIDAVQSKNLIGAGARLPKAVIDLVAKPVMERYVPRMKLGVFMDIAAHEMERMPAGATREHVREVMSAAWDSVDNRMGQMVYDNKFWNKTGKDMMFIMMRSPGWNVGTVAELGGGMIDTMRTVGRTKSGGPLITNRMAYWPGMLGATALTGAIINFLYTGQAPQSIRDYFFPRTGRKNSDGTDQRVALPTYGSQLYPSASALFHGRVADALSILGHQAVNKANPIISSTVQAATNKDYYGDQIRDPNSSALQQTLDTAKFGASQFEPFSFRNEQKMKEQTGHYDPGMVFGLTYAPRDISKSPALLLAEKIVGDKMPTAPRTQRQRESMDAKSRFLSDMQQGTVRPEEYAQRARQMDLSVQQMRQLIEKARAPRLAYLAGHMTIDEAWSVYEESTQYEKGVLKPIIRKKAVDLLKTHPDDAKAFVEAHPEIRH